MKCPQRRHRGPLGGTLLCYHLGDVIKRMFLHSGELFRSATQGVGGRWGVGRVGSLSTWVGAVSKRNLRSSSRDSGVLGGWESAIHGRARLQDPPTCALRTSGAASPQHTGWERSDLLWLLVPREPSLTALFLEQLICSSPLGPLEPVEHMTQPGWMRLHPEGLGLQVSVVGHGVACESVSSLGG